MPEKNGISQREFGKLIANSENTDNNVARMTKKLDEFLENKPCATHEANIKSAHRRIGEVSDDVDILSTDVKKKEDKRTFRWIVGIMFALMTTMLGLIVWNNSQVIP